MTGRALFARSLLARSLFALGSVVAILATTLTAGRTVALAGTLPADDLITNPSFEGGATAPWDGTNVSTVPLSNAPDGSRVAKVSAHGGSDTIDNWPGSVTSTTAGTVYSASAQAASANPGTVGSTVFLVAREHAADGSTIASWTSAPSTLSATFRTLRVQGTAHASGDLIDVYLYEQNAAAADAYYVDALALTARAPAPITNEMADASFEQQTLTPWAGLHGTATIVQTPNAPDGNSVAELSYTGTGSYMSLDDWPGTTTTERDRSYAASALVAAGTGGTSGRTAQLIVREHAADGTYVTEFDSPVTTLGSGFQQLSVHGAADRSGDILDLYVVMNAPVSGDVMLVDAVSLAPTASTLGELAIDTGQADTLGDTSRYQYVILQESQYSHIAAIKAANPQTKVLAYLDAASVQGKTCDDANPSAYSPHDSFGLNYCWVVQHHPEWLLTDDMADPLSFADFPTDLAVDIGAGGYRTVWADNASAAALADGFDGIYLDDVNTHPGHGLDGAVAEYTDQAYGQAMVGFTDTVADRLGSAGLLTIANVSVDPWVGWEVADADAMAPHLTAVNKEFFSRWGSVCGPFSAPFSDPASGGNPPWTQLQGLETGLEATGSHATGIDYGADPSSADDVRTMSYGRAGFLMGWDGRPGGAYMFRPCGTSDPANPAWTKELGLPTGPAVLQADGIWRRTFMQGVVLTNPSPTVTATVGLDGSFTDQAGHAVTGSAVLAPQTALLLTRTSYA